MTITIIRSYCKGCGVCVAFCPKQALSLDADEKAVWSSEKCIGCGLCENYCPDLAIEAKADEKPQEAQA